MTHISHLYLHIYDFFFYLLTTIWILSTIFANRLIIYFLYLCYLPFAPLISSASVIQFERKISRIHWQDNIFQIISHRKIVSLMWVWLDDLPVYKEQHLGPIFPGSRNVRSMSTSQTVTSHRSLRKTYTSFMDTSPSTSTSRKACTTSYKYKYKYNLQVTRNRPLMVKKIILPKMMFISK